MPSIDLKGIKIANYLNTNGAITYTGPQTIGDAMNVNMSLRFAEGRLYAEGALAEYIREATGGTLSIGVKYIPNAAQKVLFGAQDKTRGSGASAVTGLKYSAKDSSKEVGVAFYAPDLIDGVKKYTCVLIKRARFGLPDMVYNTKGENIQFNTPTTTGEFLPDHSTDQDMFEVAIVDTEAAATAWVTAALA